MLANAPCAMLHTSVLYAAKIAVYDPWTLAAGGQGMSTNHVAALAIVL